MDKFITLVATFQAAIPVLLFVAVVMSIGARRSEVQAADRLGVDPDADMINQVAITGMREIRNGFLWAAAVIGTFVAFVNIYIAPVA